MDFALTSLSNWECYVDTGDNSLLNDVRAIDAKSGDRAVLAGEGWERVIVFDDAQVETTG